eukprot:956010-Karenia_brevis.AAC.1
MEAEVLGPFENKVCARSGQSGYSWGVYQREIETRQMPVQGYDNQKDKGFVMHGGSCLGSSTVGKIARHTCAAFYVKEIP